MSVYKHSELRRLQDLNHREEYVLGLIEELGDIKATTLCALARCVYTKGSCLDALEKMRGEGWVSSYKATSEKISTFNMWALTPRAKFYFKQVKDLYGQNP